VCVCLFESLQYPEFEMNVWSELFWVISASQIEAKPTLYYFISLSAAEGKRGKIVINANDATYNP
jgi:hypothetical protein